MWVCISVMGCVVVKNIILINLPKTGLHRLLLVVTKDADVHKSPAV